MQGGYSLTFIEWCIQPGLIIHSVNKNGNLLATFKKSRADYLYLVVNISHTNILQQATSCRYGRPPGHLLALRIIISLRWFCGYNR